MTTALREEDEMELIVKRHPVDDCYLEFYLREKWLWTVHVDEVDSEFYKQVFAPIRENSQATVVMEIKDEMS
jgi:hypothetical protein